MLIIIDLKIQIFLINILNQQYLEEIIHRFGDDFFIDDFVKRHTEKRLAQYGLCLDDDYNQIIDFELTTKGLVEIPKVKNLKSVNNFSLLLV